MWQGFFFHSSRGDSEGKSPHLSIGKLENTSALNDGPLPHRSPCFLYRSCIMYNWGDSHRCQLVHGFKWSLQQPLFTWSQWSFRLDFEGLSFQIWEDEKHMEAPNTNWQTILICNFLEWQSHAVVWDDLRMFQVSKIMWNPKTLLAQLANNPTINYRWEIEACRITFLIPTRYELTRTTLYWYIVVYVHIIFTYVISKRLLVLLMLQQIPGTRFSYLSTPVCWISFINSSNHQPPAKSSVDSTSYGVFGCHLAHSWRRNELSVLRCGHLQPLGISRFWGISGSHSSAFRRFLEWGADFI